VQDTSDFVTEGTEFELMVRPVRGLSLMFNVSEQQSVRSNTGASPRRLLFNTPTASGDPVATEWLKDWGYNIPLSQASIPLIGSRTEPNMFAATFQRSVLNPSNARLAVACAGWTRRRWVIRSPTSGPT
jgi:hypothetical protein